MKRRSLVKSPGLLTLLLAALASYGQGRSLPQAASPLSPRLIGAQAPVSAAFPRSTASVSSADPLVEVAAGSLGHTSPFASTLPDLTFMNEQKDPLEASAVTAEAKPLINFEVNVPPRWLPSDEQESSTTVLIERSFANSYYKPSLLRYSPSLIPKGFRDPTKWTSLVLEQRGVAVGRQFDRLGTIFLGNSKTGYSTEVWRTDNAQPVRDPPGVLWEAHKDVSRYYDLFRQEGEMIFDYPNVVNDIYTAPLNITLSLTVHQLKDAAAALPAPPKVGVPINAIGALDAQSKATPLAARSPLVYSISQRNKTSASHWAVPGDKAVARFAIPVNAMQAVAEIYASGTADDEFWYGSLNTDITKQLPTDAQAGFPHGAYREVRLYVDGILAGAVAPYPVIFTGGISPLMWRPQTGFGSYDQPTYLLDLTAFLGILCDGREHEYEIKVASAEEDEENNKSWFVSGNLQVVVGKEGDITSGSTPVVEVASTKDSFVLSGSVKGNITGPDGSILSEVKSIPGGRKIKISSHLTPAGTLQGLEVVTEHTTSFSSKQTLTQGLDRNDVTQHASGSQKSTHGGAPFLENSYSYPLTFGITSDEGFLNTTLKHEYHLEQALHPLAASRGNSTSHANTGSVDGSATVGSGSGSGSGFPYPSTQRISTRQSAAGSAAKVNGSLVGISGSAQQTYSYVDSEGYDFKRTVEVVDRVVKRDEIDGSLKSQALPVQ
ncbi:hypothetical protein BCV69DRAFT_279989 [Microstroma glucosiphilum]|uniref:Peptide N-acetyl-beta-D-glucosaminyl asparaginase amidase A N-terminal domain-containing protein n=1 Tax=Pseudomicrostroma glucosiphilum TaxID=1684307 RepID=A0A316UGM7_9BASI|nr:hypothetical protein BCV69DRAFT_279989 [Pseudomicrostroma glucosiphilum]PWN24088.1 hypothetical protein BCV69DRAFT_279989 [Pseudomicrostroma glucosiphilum]